MIEKSQLTFGRMLRIWWALVWRAVLVGFVGGFVGGAVAGLAVTVAGHPELASQAGTIAGLVVSVPAGFWALRAALLARYTGFELVLQETGTDA